LAQGICFNRILERKCKLQSMEKQQPRAIPASSPRRHPPAMQSATTVAALCLAISATDAVVTGTLLHRNSYSPEMNTLDKKFRDETSFGDTALEPACSKIVCGEYSCPTPFELKVDNTCCGYCWAPDHAVVNDRHQVTKYNATGFAIDQCEGAPSTCKGPGTNAVRCFKPNCRAGDVPHCNPDSCCAMCTTR